MLYNYTLHRLLSCVFVQVWCSSHQKQRSSCLTSTPSSAVVRVSHQIKGTIKKPQFEGCKSRFGMLVMENRPGHLSNHPTASPDWIYPIGKTPPSAAGKKSETACFTSTSDGKPRSFEDILGIGDVKISRGEIRSVRRVLKCLIF